MPYLIDSHAHLNFNAYKDDQSEVIDRALNQGIWMINVGSQYDTSKRAVEIAQKYPTGVYAAIGLHPIHLSSALVDEEEIAFKSREEKFDNQKYQELVDNDQDKKIAAVGEIGLDYYHIGSLKHESIKTLKQENDCLNSLKELQKQELLKQLEFAKNNSLPVILHCRGSKEKPLDAYTDLLEVVETQYFASPANETQGIASLPCGRGVIHCFGADIATAQKFLDLGFYIGFTGVITFKNKSIDPLRQVVKYAPLDRILIETDCPYLTPEPHRGTRNEPGYVEEVAKKVAEIKEVDFEKVGRTTTENAVKLFGLP